MKRQIYLLPILLLNLTFLPPVSVHIMAAYVARAGGTFFARENLSH
jgi:hypothetical protein